MEFPRIVYRLGGDWQLESGRFSVKQVDSQEACDAALADGWHLDQYAAKDAATPAAVPAAVPDDNDPPTRAELEQKAKELGIKVDKRWGDAKIAQAIAAEMKA